RTPVTAISRHCRDVFGSGSFRAKTTAASIAPATMNRQAANVIGGRSSKPIFITIQVEPQIKHNKIQTRTVISYIRKSSANFPLVLRYANAAGCRDRREAAFSNDVR